MAWINASAIYYVSIGTSYYSVKKADMQISMRERVEKVCDMVGERLLKSDPKWKELARKLTETAKTAEGAHPQLMQRMRNRKTGMSTSGIAANKSQPAYLPLLQLSYMNRNMTQVPLLQIQKIDSNSLPSMRKCYPDVECTTK
nr:hypothetical protein [Tanacetum cinerariifolium]